MKNVLEPWRESSGGNGDAAAGLLLETTLSQPKSAGQRIHARQARCRPHHAAMPVPDRMP